MGGTIARACYWYSDGMACHGFASLFLTGNMKVLDPGLLTRTDIGFLRTWFSTNVNHVIKICAGGMRIQVPYRKSYPLDRHHAWKTLPFFFVNISTCIYDGKLTPETISKLS